MFTPICVACRREMRCRKNDFLFADYEAVAIWAGDRYECEECRASVVVGVAKEPVVVYDEPTFIQYQARSELELTRELPDWIRARSDAREAKRLRSGPPDVE